MFKKIILIIFLVPIITATMMFAVSWIKNSEEPIAPVVSMIKFYPKEGKKEELKDYLSGFSKVSDYVIPGSLFHLLLEPSEKNGAFVHLTIWRSRTDYKKAFQKFAENRGKGKDHIKNFPHQALEKPFEYHEFNIIGNVNI